MSPEAIRPRIGSITHADGTSTPIMFEQTADPSVFAIIDLDGQSVTAFQTGDTLHVDVIGPGQGVIVSAMMERQ